MPSARLAAGRCWSTSRTAAECGTRRVWSVQRTASYSTSRNPLLDSSRVRAATSSAYGTPPEPADGLGARFRRSGSVASWNGSGRGGSPNSFHHNASQPPGLRREEIFGSAALRVEPMEGRRHGDEIERRRRELDVLEGGDDRPRPLAPSRAVRASAPRGRHWARRPRPTHRMPPALSWPVQIRHRSRGRGSMGRADIDRGGCDTRGRGTRVVRPCSRQRRFRTRGAPRPVQTGRATRSLRAACPSV